MKYVQPVGAALNAAYVDANPVGGVEGSPVPAAALEHPQREIENAITAAGLAPSAGDLTQLSKAIVKLAAAYGIGGSAVAIPGGNLDSTVIPGGVYYSTPADLGTKPALDDGYGHVMVSREGTAGVTARQIYQNNSSIDIWVRCYTSTAWTPWVKQATANDLETISTPAGLVAFFARNSAPTGYLKANGAAISRATYATLFAAIGTTFGGGDGSTTFNVPDLRGEFARGWDDARGIDAGRGFGSFQKGTFHNIGSGPVVDCVSDYSISNGGAAAAADLGLDTGVPSDYPNARYGSAGTVGPTGAPMYTDASYGVTRPRNIALLACIKY